MINHTIFTIRRLLAVACAVFILLGLWIPVDAAPRLVTAIGISATGITVPDEIVGGLTTITMSNSDQAPHILGIARLKDGETPESFGAAAAANPDAIFALFDDVYSPGFQLPGGSSTFIADLQPGIWLATDILVPGPPSFFTVTEGLGDGTAEPKESAAIQFVDFGFGGLPSSMTAGKNTLKLSNRGTQNHELFVYKLEEGQSAQDFIALAVESEGNVPNEFIGGMAAGPGSELWTDLTFTPGNYIAVCNIPDVATGTPHVALGMVGTFAVAEGTAPATMPTTGADTSFGLMVMGWAAVCLLVGLTLRAAYLRTR
jgi:hypothetical protein